MNIGIAAGDRQAAASGRREPAEALRHQARNRRSPCLHLSRVRAGCQDLRQGRRLRPSRDAGQADCGQGGPGALLLDGGDTWQGSATALWTKGQDMVDACKLLGVDMMTSHWEFTLGHERVKEIVDKDFKGKIEFLAQNVKTTDFGDQVFKPYAMREMNGVKVADHRPGLPVYADRQPALHGARLDLRHPGRGDAEGRDQGARRRRAGRGGAFAQRHGRGSQDGEPRHRHRRHPRRPHPRRRTRTQSSSRTPAARPWSPTPDPTASSSSCSTSTSRAARSRTSATSCCRCSPTCCRPTRRWRRSSTKCARRTRASWRKSSPSAKACSTAAATSTATWDQLILDAMMEVKGRADRLLARLPLGHQPPARPGDHHRAPDGPDRHHLPVLHPHRHERRDRSRPSSKTSATTCSIPIPTTSRAATWCASAASTYTCDPNAKMGNRIQDMRLDGKPIEAGQDLQGGGLGAGGGRRQRRTDLGRGGALAARPRRPSAAPKLNLPKLVGMAGNPGLA